MPDPLEPHPRRKSVPVKIGHVTVGGDAPIVVQSMTNTDTADVEATAAQAAALARAGSELVRVTVDRADSARAVPRIREWLDRQGVNVPLVGDFHYIGHKLLTQHPDCALALAKYRINPGNVGFRDKRDKQFATMIEVALKNDRPVRIGVNWGSLDQDLLTRLMDDNARADRPKEATAVVREALVVSALAVLLQNGIGDTIRISLTPEPGGDRTREVVVAQEILQTMGLQAFNPMVTACPGCGRTTSTVFQELAGRIQDYVRARMPEWRRQRVGVEGMSLAVMGCIVNGPGESKHADVGISLPGTGEEPAAPVFIDGVKTVTLRGPRIAEAFEAIVEDYVGSHYPRRA